MADEKLGDCALRSSPAVPRRCVSRCARKGERRSLSFGRPLTHPGQGNIEANLLLEAHFEFHGHQIVQIKSVNNLFGVPLSSVTRRIDAIAAASKLVQRVF